MYAILLLTNLTVRHFGNKDELKIAMDVFNLNNVSFEVYRKYGGDWARMEKIEI